MIQSQTRHDVSRCNEHFFFQIIAQLTSTVLVDCTSLRVYSLPKKDGTNGH